MGAENFVSQASDENVHPCTFSSTSFCCAKTSLLRGTTAVRGGAEIAVFGRRWFYAEMRFAFGANLMLRGVTGMFTSSAVD